MYQDADFGKLEDIDGEVIIVEDQNGKFRKKRLGGKRRNDMIK